MKAEARRRRYVPARGDVVWLSPAPQSGHERAGRRPAVVLTPASYNATVGLAVFCPITGQVKGYPFEVRVPANVGVDGVILADQVKSLDWRVRRAKLLARVPGAVVKEVLVKLQLLLEP